MKNLNTFLDSNYIPHLSVSFIFILFLLGYVQIFGKDFSRKVPYKQNLSSYVVQKVEDLIMKEQRQAQVEDTIETLTVERNV